MQRRCGEGARQLRRSTAAGKGLPWAQRAAALGVVGLAFVIAVVGVDAREPRIVKSTYEGVRALRDPERQMMVLFYEAAGDDAEAQLAEFSSAAQELQGDGFEFYSVDVSLGDDAREAVKQGLDSFPAVFVKPHALGIVQYPFALTARTLVEYARSLSAAPADPRDLLHFTTEDDFYDIMDLSDAPLPVFVFFHESTCAGCEAVRRQWGQAATALQGTAHFMSVQCSETPAHSVFCDRNAIENVPAFVLFTGEEKLEYDGPVDVLSVRAWLEQNKDRFPAAILDDDHHAPAVASGGSTGTCANPEEVDQLREQVREQAAELRRLRRVLKDVRAAVASADVAA